MEASSGPPGLHWFFIGKLIFFCFLLYTGEHIVVVWRQMKKVSQYFLPICTWIIQVIHKTKLKVWKWEFFFYIWKKVKRILAIFCFEKILNFFSWTTIAKYCCIVKHCRQAAGLRKLERLYHYLEKYVGYIIQINAVTGRQSGITGNYNTPSCELLLYLIWLFSSQACIQSASRS